MDGIVEALQPYWLGLLIGFIIGLERERAQGSEMQAFGLRTFSLIGLLGSFTGTPIPVYFAALTVLFVLTAILLGYWRSTQDHATADYGFTTEISAFCVFVLGHISVKEPVVAGILGAFILALLAGRNWLHQFTRQRITKKEADALISLIVVGAGILPLLPREALDPWGLFVPFKLGSLVLALAFVQFLSYVLLKFFGERAGFLLAGFLAGLVSSTAAFANLRRELNVTDRTSLAGTLSYGLMAVAATTIMSMAIIVTNSRELLMSLIWSFGLVLLSIAVIAAICLILTRKEHKAKEYTKDPLNWKSQISFAVVLFLILALTKVAADIFGQEALWIVSFISGLFELQGVTFALAATENFSPQVMIAMTLAYVASLISKMGLILTAKDASMKGKVLVTSALIWLLIVFLGCQVLITEALQ